MKKRWFCCQIGQKEKSQSNVSQIKDSLLRIKHFVPPFTFLFSLLLKWPLVQTCIFFVFNASFSFLYAEWVIPRRFHSRVNQAETPIHQTGMRVLFLLIEGIQRWGGQNLMLVSYSSRVWAPLQDHMPSQATPYLHGRGLGRRGCRIPSRINTKSPNGAWGGKSSHTAMQFRDATWAFRRSGLILRLLVFSSLIWRLMLMDKTVFREQLLVDL